jgi:6-phosphogluconolactonase
MIEKMPLKIFSSTADLFHFAAHDFANRAIQAVAEKNSFSVVLAGGETPTAFFDSLSATNYAEKNIPWEKIQFFFGDERYVPADDPKSNYRLANKHLFSKVPVKPGQIYPIPTTFKDPTAAAEAYEQTLRKVFHLNTNDAPPFDLVYLGLGDDAHTASLMPDSALVKHSLMHSDNKQLVGALLLSATQQYRITLTPTAINHALTIIFIVTGAAKATAVAQVIEGARDPLHYPAQLIDCITGKTLWYLDQGAAIYLKKTNC